MRLGVWLWLAVAALAQGCAGDYPLPPTPCDDWCDVTKGVTTCSGEYSPAGCVSQCEALGITAPACRAVFDLTLACYREHPRAAAQQCYYNPNVPFDCELEAAALAQCAANDSPFGSRE